MMTINWLLTVWKLKCLRDKLFFSERRALMDAAMPRLKGITCTQRIAWPDAFFMITMEDVNRAEQVIFGEEAELMSELSIDDTKEPE